MVCDKTLETSPDKPFLQGHPHLGCMSCDKTLELALLNPFSKAILTSAACALYGTPLAFNTGGTRRASKACAACCCAARPRCGCGTTAERSIADGARVTRAHCKHTRQQKQIYTWQQPKDLNGLSLKIKLVDCVCVDATVVTVCCSKRSSKPQALSPNMFELFEMLVC